MPALPYHEPVIATILTLSAFLILLNVVNFFLDNVLFCGLLGQLVLGMAWGTPGWQWLGTTFEEVVVKLGYLGLVLLVYEGGLTTSFKALRANIVLSTVIAITGVIMPIGLSFLLKLLVSATSVQAFAAGVALCSTSLGTTLTIISASGLSKSRLGTVIIGAAILDDVAGLVLVQVLSNLAASGGVIDIKTCFRPFVVSIAFVIVVLLGCRYAVAPLTRQLNGRDSPAPFFAKALQNLPQDGTIFVIHTSILFTMVAGATYAGTSPLFAAYVAGASINWWDETFGCDMRNGRVESVVRQRTLAEELNVREALTSASEEANTVAATSGPPNGDTQRRDNYEEIFAASKHEGHPAGTVIYAKYYSALVERVLKPLFFASIGFAIPITEMFERDIVWRGLVYSLLMAFSKLVTGIWLMRTGLDLSTFFDFGSHVLRSVRSWLSRITSSKSKKSEENGILRPTTRLTANGRVQSDYGTTFSDPPRRSRLSYFRSRSSQDESTSSRSLYPASVTGLAMIARGEIGFLISSLAEGEGIFSRADSRDDQVSAIYLVVTWAIMICTIIGPLALGALVRRVQRLQALQQTSGGPDPLRGWQ